MIKPLSIKNKLSKPNLEEPSLSIKFAPSSGGKELSVADPRALRALVALMDMEAVLGGAASHFGGPSAMAEINAVLYAMVFEHGEEWTKHFNLINDAGHCENGLYALKALYEFGGLKIEDLKKFRSIESPLTGHGEVHVYPEGVQLSNGPLGSSVGQAQGLALGDKLSGKSTTTVLTLSDGGAMEGEAREGLASIPGWAAKGHLNPFVLIISDNNTKLSSRIDEDSFSMKPTFDSLETLGWKVFKDIDGHDMDAVHTAFLAAFNAKAKTPVALHFKTVKGKGFKQTEDSSSGGHGFPLKTQEGLRDMLNEIYSEELLPPAIESWITDLESRLDHMPDQPVAPAVKELKKKEKIQVGLAKALIELKKEGYPLISVSSDLYGSTGLADFRKEFPESSFDVGIAESNMVSVGAGLAKTGFIPMVDTFAQFGVTKGALPITMASLSEAPVLCFFSHTGFQDAADGASHQALSYFAMMSSIPNVNVVSLSCSSEAYKIVKDVIFDYKELVDSGETPNSTVFFLGRENFPEHYVEDAKYSLNRETVLYDSEKPEALILTTGSLVPQAVKAYEELKEEGRQVSVVTKSFINSGFTTDFKDLLAKAGGNLIVAEDHQKVSGFGSYALSKIVEQFGFDSIKSFKQLGVDGKFGRSAYKADELYAQNQMDAEAIKKLV
jgi:transketolase